MATTHIVTYTDARAQLAELLDRAVEDCEVITITRRDHEPAVLMSAAEYESLRETAYLLRSPENARRLLGALISARQGEGTRMTFDELRNEVEEKLLKAHGEKKSTETPAKAKRVTRSRSATTVSRRS